MWWTQQTWRTRWSWQVGACCSGLSSPISPPSRSLQVSLSCVLTRPALLPQASLPSTGIQPSSLSLRYPRLTRQANIYATGTLLDYNPTSHGSLRPPTRITPKIDIHPLCNPLHRSIPSPPKPCDRFMPRCLQSLRVILRGQRANQLRPSQCQRLNVSVRQTSPNSPRRNVAIWVIVRPAPACHRPPLLPSLRSLPNHSWVVSHRQRCLQGWHGGRGRHVGHGGCGRHGGLADAVGVGDTMDLRTRWMWGTWWTCGLVDLVDRGRGGSSPGEPGDMGKDPR